MKKFYSLVILFSFLLMSAHAAFINRGDLLRRVDGIIDTTKKSKSISKITDKRPGKPSEIKSVKVNITPFKPSMKPVATASPNPKNTTNTDSKILSNVKVYPNPVEERLNLSYFINKDSNVTIKIMDVLGNEISTLLSQRLPAGEQINTFNITSTLNTGYYFIRILVAGEKPIVKRISVL